MNRKYRQQGYQDSSRRERDPERFKSAPRPALTPEERIQKRSMRHAIDREANEVLRCHNCGRNVQNVGGIGTASTCPHCAAALHCCRNCVHFDSASRWQCRAEITEPVGQKINANDCSLYSARLVLDVTGRRTAKSSSSSSSDPKSAFEDLFKR